MSRPLPLAPDRPALRGAILGLGNVAVHAHLPGWRARSDVEIVAATDPAPGRMEMAARVLPGARWYDSAEDLLAAERLDFVDICAPPSSHAGLVAAALDRGLDVLCEKPLVSDPEALTPLRRLATERGRVLHTVHNWHHAPVVAQAARLIGEGALGPVEHIRWETLRVRPAAAGDAATENWRVDPALAGGGVLTDHGWHVFYVLRRLAGEDPIAVSAELCRRRHLEWPVEDTARVCLQFPTSRAEALLTWAADERATRAEVSGRDGSLRLDDATLVLTTWGRPDRRWSLPPGLSAGSHHPEWFGGVAEHFVAAARGAAPREGNLHEASLCVALEALARASSRRGAAALPVAQPAGAASGTREPVV